MKNPAIAYLDEVIAGVYFSGHAANAIKINIEQFVKKADLYIMVYERERQDWVIDTHDGVLESFYKSWEEEVSALAGEAEAVLNLIVTAGNATFSDLLHSHEKVVMHYESALDKMADSLGVISIDLRDSGIREGLRKAKESIERTGSNIQYVINTA